MLICNVYANRDYTDYIIFYFLPQGTSVLNEQQSALIVDETAIFARNIWKLLVTLNISGKSVIYAQLYDWQDLFKMNIIYHYIQTAMNLGWHTYWYDEKFICIDRLLVMYQGIIEQRKPLFNGTRNNSNE